MRLNKKHIAFLFVFMTFIGCRDPFEIETISFESALVIEATITNELKTQSINLSRTYLLEDDTPTLEDNATVWIEDNQNNSFHFFQNTEGVYLSDIEFKAEPNINYTLFIITEDGKQYSSSQVSLTPNSQINNLFAKQVIKDNGEEGIHVLVDSNNENSEARFFRYEYIETYKVIPPNHTFNDVSSIEITNSGIEVELIGRTQEERICYSSVNSFGIIQTSINELENHIISEFPIRFINKSNGIIRDRYSILVKQYVQSLEAYTFYKIINELGSINSLLSENQSGYVPGNIQSVNNSSEKVVGYFDISTVDSKRIYFNYQDFDISMPDYIHECFLVTLDLTDPDDLNDANNHLFNYNYQYVSYVKPLLTIVNPPCGDCTSVSSNIKPDFWED